MIQDIHLVVIFYKIELLKEKERPIHCIEDEDKTKELYVKQKIIGINKVKY